MGIETMIPSLVGEGFFTTQLNKVMAWGRKNSLWPYPFGTACCAIELMATLNSRYDLSRFGAEVIRFSPRQSDLMIVSGRVTLKMMPVLGEIYAQMAEPKWVISMGACASTGGVFNTYPQIQGVDQFIPVDVYVPGCPPRPESLIDGFFKIQQIIDGQAERGEFTRPDDAPTPTPKAEDKPSDETPDKSDSEDSKGDATDDSASDQAKETDKAEATV